jgi:hypothetical protein
MSTTSEQSPERVQAGRRYESRDLSPRTIGYATAALFAGIGLSIVIATGLLLFLRHELKRPFVTSLETSHQTPPAPRLEGYYPSDRAKLEAAAQQALQGYAWTDDKRDTAHIPIERAMQILSRKGWPDAAKEGTQ